MIVLLLTQAAPPADTVVIVPARDAVDLVFALAAASVAATFAALLVLIGGTILQLYRGGRALREAQRKFVADPGVESLRKTAANVEAISESLREEVSKLASSFSSLSERVEQASDRMEERIEEFNALLEVVQEEAEDAFVDSASSARGLRAGLGRLGSRSADRAATRRKERRAEKDGPARTEGRPPANDSGSPPPREGEHSE